MKYPQLVSTKAVNEISEWLIKRLEDLDIEHPHIYSRYLLSLLHTPLKVNAIDLEELKQPHRLLRKNNEELKRLNAVQSLMNMSAEQNESSIVNLVDELHSKLRKLESEEITMTNRAVVANSVSSSPISTSSSSSKLHKNLKKIKRNHHGTENPTKNYYLAFPALSGNKMASKTATVTSATAEKPLLNAIAGEGENEKDSGNMSLLSWSKLMTNKPPSVTAIQREKTPQQQRRKQKRYEKGIVGSKRIQQKEVQFATKSYNLNDNSTFSPKKMQMVKSNNANNKKAKHQRNNNYDSPAKRIINNNPNSKNCDIRNNNLSNYAQNAPPKMDGTTLGPWDMDFKDKGHWEMDHDLIGEFIQRQNGGDEVDNKMPFPNDEKKMKVCAKVVIVNNNNNDNDVDEDDEDTLLMKCLPMKLIDDSLHESDLSHVRKVCSNKEALSISSLKSKFDENVKAIWSDGNEPLKPLTHKAYGGSNASLASSFMSDKNSLGLFNFNEPPIPIQSSSSSSLQYHHLHALQQQNKNFCEVIAPPITTTAAAAEMAAFGCKGIDYDYNNNNHMFFNGVRGVISNGSDNNFGSSPYNKQQDNYFGKTDFIKSGTNIISSIWSDGGGGFTSDPECLILQKQVVDDDCDEIDSISLSIELPSIGAEVKMKEWLNSTEVEESEDDDEITLINHSVEQSAFRKFKPLIVSSQIIRANYHPLNRLEVPATTAVTPSSSQDTAAAAATAVEQENLLTSEKTHFSPIIRDGHTFPIDDNWDEIQWERSESGGLFYKQKRYQVAKKQENIFFIDTIDLSATIEECLDENADGKGLIVKFQVCENEKGHSDKGCQTEDNEILRMGRTYLEINEEYCRRKIYDEYFKAPASETNNKWRLQNNDDDEFTNNHSFFTRNGPPPPKLLQEMLISSNSSSSSICTITSAYDAPGNVEDPFESWRNLNADQDHKHNCGHGLWEQCIACAHNNEDLFIEKPVPANRLLKDELQLDGDEIMNVIQNLYITSHFCDDDEDKDDDCDGFVMNHVIDMIAMDDSMDGIEEEEQEAEDLVEQEAEEVESKFYEEEIAGKNQKKKILTLEDIDDVALAKMQNVMGNKDHENCIKFFKWIKSTFGEESADPVNTSTTTPAIVDNIQTADTNNNECFTHVSKVQQPSNNRKRRHSTCQNLLQKRRFDSQEQGFTYQLNYKAESAPSYDFDAVKNFFLDAANVLNINIENILLITNPTSMELASYHHEQDQGENYYRNILQQQHALVKNLELSRPLTR